MLNSASFPSRFSHSGSGQISALLPSVAGDVKLGHVLGIQQLLEGSRELEPSFLIDLGRMVAAKHLLASSTFRGWLRILDRGTIYSFQALRPFPNPPSSRWGMCPQLLRLIPLSGPPA